MVNKTNKKPTHLTRKDVEPDPYLSRNEFKPEFYNQPGKRPITAETMYGKGTKRILEQEEISPDDQMFRYKKGGVAALDESDAHETKESKKQEARETRLEKKGYVETKTGKMKKPKKAFMGLAVEALNKSNFQGAGAIGLGADKLLKNSETARNITSNLGIGGKMLSNYYSDLAGNKTPQQNTPPVKAYTGKAIKQPTETSNEFQIRHEYHTPFKGPQKGKRGKMIKKYRTGDEVQGPFLEGITPEIEKSAEGAEGSQVRFEKERAGLTAHTKVGDIGISKSKTKSYNPGNPELKQSDTRINYSKNFELGESGNLNVYGSKGISKSEYSGYGDSKKSQGTFSVGARYTHKFNKGGLLKQGKPKVAIKGWK